MTGTLPCGCRVTEVGNDTFCDDCRRKENEKLVANYDRNQRSFHLSQIKNLNRIASALIARLTEADITPVVYGIELNVDAAPIKSTYDSATDGYHFRRG